MKLMSAIGLTLTINWFVAYFGESFKEFFFSQVLRWERGLKAQSKDLRVFNIRVEQTYVAEQMCNY